MSAPDKYFYCVPPIQVKFRRHPEDAVSGRLQEGYVSVAADTSTRLIRKAIAEKLLGVSSGKSDRKLVVVEGGDSSQSDDDETVPTSFSKSSSSSYSYTPTKSAIHSLSSAMTLEVPVPCKGANESPLSLNGYMFHALKEPNMTIAQVLSWYEEQLTKFGEEGPSFDLLICYKVAYEGRDASPCDKSGGAA